jgi:AcrR family transcriptional regulator
MSEIAARVGGSKATLYGYFRSKEELFVAVALAESEKQLGPAFAALDQPSMPLRDALVKTGETLITFILTPDAIAAHRMVVSEAGRSQIGPKFYECGRKLGTERLAAFLKGARNQGKIRACDVGLAAIHLMALLESEWLPLILYGLARPAPTRREIRESMEHAVDAFLTGYEATQNHP